MSSPVNGQDPNEAENHQFTQNEFFPSGCFAFQRSSGHLAPTFDFGDDDEEEREEREAELVKRVLEAGPDDWNPIHIFNIRAQGNVYTLSALTEEDGSSRMSLLSACLDLPLYSFGVKSLGDGSVEPRHQELEYAEIPSGGEIMSIDAFKRNTPSESKTLVGITFVKQVHDSDGVPMSAGQYFNIHVEWTSPKDMKSLSDDYYPITLSFVPYHLTHCDVPVPQCLGAFETVFILTGSDNRIHVFLEISNDFVEAVVNKVFPEFMDDFPSIPTQVEFRYVQHSNQRLTAVGCECGEIFVFLVEFDNNVPSIKKTWTYSYGDGPVNTLQFFPASKSPIPSFVANKDTISENVDETENIKLLAVHSFTESLVFDDVAAKGLSSFQHLEGSHLFDQPNSGTALDLDCNGNFTIVIGTFGQMVLTYKLISNEWRLSNARPFEDPVYIVRALDLTGDGVLELAVMTSKGVHILQQDLKRVQTIRDSRLASLMKTL